MAEVEDWSDGDFDLDHTELRTDHMTLQDVYTQTSEHSELDAQPSWDDDFPGENLDDASDEQADTIKLSAAASSALKQMLEATKAASSSAHPVAQVSLDDQLRPPALDLGLISGYITGGGVGLDDPHACSTASLSASTSTSYRSMMGLSTDLTDPDSPNSKNGGRNSSSLSSRSSDRARSDRSIHSSEQEDDLEFDFELTPDMNNLSLCSSLSRARSNTSLSQVSRDLWDDDVAGNAPSSTATHAPSSLLHPSSSSRGSSSVKSVSGESDADDEHEDVLDGLDVGGSIFEFLPESSTQTSPSVKAKLEAILDLKRSGRQSSSANDQNSATDTDAGIAAGLIIDDDFDLSPSRIAARGLPTKPSHPFNAHGGLARHRIESSASEDRHTAHEDDHDRRHPARTASQHSSRMLAPDVGSIRPPSTGTRSEMRGLGRHNHHLRFKRSASDLQQHVPTSSNHVPTPSSRAPNRGSQLTRKRSLPSMKTSPPAASATPSTVGTASMLSVRQRHNSGTSTATSSSRFRPKGASRLTDSTAASRARAAETAADQSARLQKDLSAPARPSTPVSFPLRSSHQPASRITVHTRSKIRSNQEHRDSSGENQPVARLLKRSATYGNGAELDGIDDLPNAKSPVVAPSRSLTSSEKITASRAPASAGHLHSAPQRGTQSKRAGRRGPKSKPALIRSLGAGASPAHKTVKGMCWNAQALRWEGNEGVLRDFDQVIQSSTRPALISQLTGSSTSSALTHAAGYSSPISPESSTLMNHIASGARVVGDMLFDPVQMRWVHKSGEEEDDVFAQFDEPLQTDDASHDPSFSKLGIDGDNTVRARRTRSNEAFSCSSNPWTRLSQQNDTGSSVLEDDAHGRSLNRKNDQAIRRALSRGAFAPSVGIDRELWDACVQAEKRHAVEVDGCLPRADTSRSRSRTHSCTSDRAMTMDEIDRPRPHLYYLENIAKSIAKPDSRS